MAARGMLLMGALVLPIAFLNARAQDITMQESLTHYIVTINGTVFGIEDKSMNDIREELEGMGVVVHKIIEIGEFRALIIGPPETTTMQQVGVSELVVF